MNSLEIIHRSADLRSGYALWADDQQLDHHDEINATSFLLGYAVFSQTRYRNTIIDEHIFRTITCPKPPYLTKLELFVAGLDNNLINNNDDIATNKLHKWYYTVGITKYKLIPLLCENEIDDLSRIKSYRQFGIDVTFLDEIIYENNSTAKTMFNLSQRFGLVSYLSWKTRTDLFELAPWMPQKRRSDQGTHEVPNKRSRYTSVYRNDSQVSYFCGINIIGFAGRILGLGEDLRSFVRIARGIGVNLAVVDIPLSDQHATSLEGYNGLLNTVSPIFPINLFCVPLFETEGFRLRTGTERMRGRYNIGNWAWELSTLPEYWCHAFKYMDEIWAISPFLQGVYSNLTKKPVFYMPPYVHVGAFENFELTELGLDDSHFIFLSLCDFNSFSARKNPVGAVHAFQNAFPSRKSDERLILKTLNGHAKSQELSSLLLEIDHDPRIILIDGPYSRGKTMGLISKVNCFISLHRSEGFGRVLAEAMLLTTPVIATGYSGSNAVLDEKTGFPVEYSLVPVPSTQYCYSEGSVWAEPHLDSAVDHMRFVARDTGEVSIRVQEGFRRVTENHGFDAVAKLVRDRLQNIVEFVSK